MRPRIVGVALAAAAFISGCGDPRRGRPGSFEEIAAILDEMISTVEFED